jgi:uncharacterized metal-binding protein
MNLDEGVSVVGIAKISEEDIEDETVEEAVESVDETTDTEA